MCVLASCGLPRVGPNKREIFAGSVQRQGDAFIVAVNDRVTRATAVVPALGLFRTLPERRRRRLGHDQPRRHAGPDRSGRTSMTGCWPARRQIPPCSKRCRSTARASSSCPMPAASTPPATRPRRVRRIITERLADQTPDPQVQVRRARRRRRDRVGRRRGRRAGRLSDRTADPDAVGHAGARRRRHDRARDRAGHRAARRPAAAEIWFQDLYKNPGFDIALRGGDRILVEEDTRAFTALGATGTQARVPVREPDALGDRGASRRSAGCSPPRPIRPASSCSATSPPRSPTRCWAAATSSARSAWSTCWT